MNKIKKLKYIIAIVIMLAIVFTNKANAATGIVTTETLNLRSEPSTSSSVVELLNADEELEIISEEGNWYKVKHGSNEGYVSKDYVEVNGTLEEEPDTTTANENNPTNPDNNASSNNDVANNGIVILKNDTTIKILPLINASSIGEAKSGEEVEIITSTNKWVFIQTDELSGWILNPDIEITTTVPENNEKDTNTEQEPENSYDENFDEENQNQDSQEEETQEEEISTNDSTYTESSTKYVNASSIYVRSEPSTDSDIVTTLIRDTDVTVTGESGDWYKVKYADYTGYIYKELLSDTKTEITNRSSTNVDRTANASSENKVEETANNTSSKGEEIVEYAKQYLGCPYVYGGSGSSSFDCSGFTMYVYQHFGYSLSHSAISQSKVGTYVEKENLQPGDLVFFLEWDTMDEIGHCGIYIGEGNFIHASSGSGYCVKISNLDTGSYCTRYDTARRLI